MNATSCILTPLAYNDRRGVETSQAATAPVRPAVFLFVLPTWILSMVWRAGKYPIPSAVLERFLTSKPPLTGHRFNLEKTQGGHCGQ